MGDSNNMQAAAVAAAAAGWGQHAAAYPGMHRYAQMSQYRQQPISGYGSQHQEPKQPFPATGSQHPMMQQPHQPPSYQMQQRHTPHYPQAGSGGYGASASQGYAGYMHQRLPPHHQYPQTHHQMDMAAAVSQQAQQYNQVNFLRQKEVIKFSFNYIYC